MLRKFWSGIVGRERKGRQPERDRIFLEEMPAAIYAIGDIHGCHRLLKALEAKIVEDAASIDGEKWLVCLGDYIDRGTSSAMVLDHLLARPPAGFRRFCIAGNHEHIAFDFIRNGNYTNGWLDFGGRETLASYGLYEPSKQAARLGRQLASHIPEEHIEFLGSLPTMVSLPGLTFVHAGIDPNRSLRDQDDEVLLWSRPPDFVWPAGGTGQHIIHGHTPVVEPDLSQDRINIDLGAYSSGILGAVKVTRDNGMSIILAS
jgi:serine/threonine protein phosphatase 1